MSLRRLSRHCLALLLIWGIGVTLVPATAAAWQAVVLPRRAATIDVAPTPDAARAVFADLRAGGALRITLGGSLRATAHVDLYVPDREPERTLSRARTPWLDDGDAAPQQQLVAHRAVEDEATGLRFRHLATLALPAGSAGFDVRARRSDSRVLVVVRGAGAPKEFKLDDPTKVPQTVARMRVWYDTLVSGSPQPDDATNRRSASMITGAALGGVIVAAMLALALWWGMRGRSAARRPRNDT